MHHRNACRSCLLILALATVLPAQVKAPRYEECLLAAVYPAGGKQGDTVTVELLGGGNANMTGVKSVLIDGPPGIVVRDVKTTSPSVVQATFAIAPDAAPGRRCVRVLNESSGLTNMIYFSVGRLPETLEKEPNNDAPAAQPVTLPVVVNGRVHPKADVDCFRFDLKKGQRLVAAVLAHAFDSHGQYPNGGIVDATLQLLDSKGRVVAEAGDTLGLDPQLDFVATAEGTYLARVHLEAFEGYPQAIYRLVLGDVALATSLFPPGGQRGTTVAVELSGPNVPPGTKQQVRVPADDRFPLQHVLPAGQQVADLELPFVRGDFPEVVETEPNGKAEQATLLQVPQTANGRFDAPGDEDWYRLRLTAGQSVRLETTAQRYLRAPVDTLIEVFDSVGKKLAENDDGFALDYVSMHDYRLMDSRLTFTAATAGEYCVRVTDQAGGGGPRSVYRLTVAPAEPDFELYLFPDGVPIWGAGSTAALLVKVNRFDKLDGDITLTVEGLPAGWIGSPGVSRGQGSKPGQAPWLYQFLTITAPPDAQPGTAVPFRVMGRAEVNGRTVERTAQPLTLYYTTDTGFFRNTPLARAAVARPLTPWLSTTATALTAPHGGAIDIPVTVHNADKVDRLDLTANVAGPGVATGVNVPLTVPVKNGKAVLSLQLPAERLPPGRYGITVSLSWRSDIRIGMPGPCTPLVLLEVLAKP